MRIRQAWELCQQLGDTSALFPVLVWVFGILPCAAEQQTSLRGRRATVYLRAAASMIRPSFCRHMRSRRVRYCGWGTLCARVHTGSSASLYMILPATCRFTLRYGDPAVMGLSHLALGAVDLGYPDQAVQKIQTGTGSCAAGPRDAFSIAYGTDYWKPGLSTCGEKCWPQEYVPRRPLRLLPTKDFRSGWRRGCHRGWPCRAGHAQEGIRQIEQGYSKLGGVPGRQTPSRISCAICRRPMRKAG